VQSTPETVDPAMALPLRLNAIGLLLVVIWMASRRARLEGARRIAESAAPPARVVSEEVARA
jgi:hypothetical protein